MRFTQRTASLKPEGAYQVLARANQLEAAGRDIIHFEIGQPDYPTFENIRKAGIAAIESGKTRYTPPSGPDTLGPNAELRRSICAERHHREGDAEKPRRPLPKRRGYNRSAPPREGVADDRGDARAVASEAQGRPAAGSLS